MNAIILGMKAATVKQIISGKKKAELMKKRPSLLELPIKVYIYEQKGEMRNQPHISYTTYRRDGRGMVVGECVCSRIQTIDLSVIDENIKNMLHMKAREITEYLDGKTGYILFFSDVKIYDELMGIEAFGKRVPPAPWCRVEEKQWNKEKE